MIRLLALLLVTAAGAALSQPAPDSSTGQSDCAASYSRDRRTGKPAPSDCSLRVSRSKALKAQVSGGDSAPDERFTAAIFYKETDQQTYICTGVLLDERHILTAGHCGCGSDYQVTFDQHARNRNPTSRFLDIDGPPILLDPLTCLRRAKPGSDLALLRLKERYAGDTSNPVNLANVGYPAFSLAMDLRAEMKPGAGLKIVGYGETETGSVADRMKASVPVLTTDCFERPYRLSCAPFLEMILADREGRQIPRDTCGGDSGGPVLVSKKINLPKCLAKPNVDYDNEEKFPVLQDVLAAITSRAAPFTQPLGGGHCGGGGIYTLIGRRSVYAWFDANHVKPQRCFIEQ
jgi:hypothetical protein